MTRLLICASEPTDRRIIAGICPDCKKRTRFLGWFHDWHGWFETCLRCGRQFDGGEKISLEFCRGSRKMNIEQSKARWRRTQ